jgi:hypothetical protein
VADRRLSDELLPIAGELGRLVREPVSSLNKRSALGTTVVSLSSPIFQRELWGREFYGIAFYHDFSLDVYTLYDDCMVLPEPGRDGWQDVIYEDEIASLRALGKVLTPLINELGEVPDGVYLDDSCWPTVVSAAQGVRRVFDRSGWHEGLPWWWEVVSRGVPAGQ